MPLKEMRQTRRAGLLNVKRRTFKCAGKRNDHMLHYEQVFGNVSEKRESKCCAVFKRWTSDHSPNGSVTKNKNISDVPGQISCCQCKYLVKDSDNEFTECQTPRKKFQWIDISPVNLQAFTETLKRSISEAQKVQVEWLNNSESDSYDKNYMQEKVNVLVRLQEATQEKLKTASYSEPIQFLTMVPDEWSPRHVSEYFNIFEYLHIKSKK